MARLNILDGARPRNSYGLLAISILCTGETQSLSVWSYNLAKNAVIRLVTVKCGMCEGHMLYCGNM